MPEDLLRMEKIEKRFGGIHALRGVDLVVRHGEVHALVGENGAGKSTLIKILTGAIRKDAGRVIFDGEEREIGSPVEARSLGISTIYQDVTLFPFLSVAENLAIGNRVGVRRGTGWIDAKEMRRAASELIDRFGLDINVTTSVGTLSLAEMRIVEVLRAVSTQARLLVMDEATTGMSKREIDALFGIVREAIKRGLTVLYISHHLDEIFEIASTVTVLRDGQVVGTFRTDAVTMAELTEAIVGRQLGAVVGNLREPQTDNEEIALEVESLTTQKLPYPLTFSLRRGEILGVTGSVGAGKTELARALFGVDRKTSGKVKILGRDIGRGYKPAKAKLAGVGFIPEDRRAQGLFPGLNVGNNLVCVAIERVTTLKAFLNMRRWRQVAAEGAERCRIAPADPGMPVLNLSGGNQQKVVIAKWMLAKLPILIMDEPTRGIDVGAKAEIRSLIRNLTKDGVSVLYLSSDFGDVLGIADRILVMRKGRFVAEVTASSTDLRALTMLALG